jgi:hypothetical protein
MAVHCALNTVAVVLTASAVLSRINRTKGESNAQATNNPGIRTAKN